MRVLRSLEADPAPPLERVIALGNFDGLHRGHMSILARARQIAERLNTSPLVFTFEPHPLKVLRGAGSVRLLQTAQQKIDILDKLGFAEVVLYPFTQQFSRMAPDEFVTTIIAGKLRATGVVVGTAFTFGHDRSGDVGTLVRCGDQHGFEVKGVQPARHRGHVISSTWIRKCIEESHLDESRFLLDRPFSISGEVITGDKRGATIGYPTANVRAEQEVIPPSGVYVTVSRSGQTLHPSVTNIGFRPTFRSDSELTIESHLLDFDDDMYGQQLEVYFLAKLRDELRFDSPAALIRQLDADVLDARAYHAAHPHSTIDMMVPHLPIDHDDA